MKRKRHKHRSKEEVEQDAMKAARKKSREDEIAAFGKQVSMYYWVGDKKHHARGGKHKNRYF